MQRGLTLLWLIVVPGALAARPAEMATYVDADGASPPRIVFQESPCQVPPDAGKSIDIPQMPGFPTHMTTRPSTPPMRGLLFADLVGDSRLEIITGSSDSKLYVWDADANPVPGFPLPLSGWVQFAPSVGDVDGDGNLEIVVFTVTDTAGGELYIIDQHGQVLPGFPLSFQGNNPSHSPVLYDLDGDGNLEILHGERHYPTGSLRIFEHDGTEWGGNWPLALDHVPAAAPSVGDVDRDGRPEIFFQSYLTMYLLRTDGTSLPGWPRQIPGATFSYASGALADLDGDQDRELVVGVHGDISGCYVFHHDGSIAPGWPYVMPTWSYCPPTVTDLEGDGELEILTAQNGFLFFPPSDYLWALTPNGHVKSGFPFCPPSYYGGGCGGPLTTADIDGDGRMEIFADHNMRDDRGFLFGLDSAGRELAGFPLRPVGSTYFEGATIGDIDLDGDYELGVLSFVGTDVCVNVYDLPYRYQRTARDWPIYHARPSRGGLYPAVDVGVPGDLDGDGDVDLADLAILLADYECTGGGCAGDIDGDGDTDLADLATLLANYGFGT